MKILGGFLAILFLIALILAWFSLAVWLAVWNVTDMQANGVSFWPMLWLFVSGLMVFGPSSAVSLNK